MIHGTPRSLDDIDSEFPSSVPQLGDNKHLHLGWCFVFVCFLVSCCFRFDFVLPSCSIDKVERRLTTLVTLQLLQLLQQLHRFFLGGFGESCSCGASCVTFLCGLFSGESVVSSSSLW